MLQHKTMAIVLYTTAYNDKNSIAHLYTEKFGRVGYWIPAGESKRARQLRLLFAPLAILEIDVEHLPSRNLQRIKEARQQVMLYGIQADPVKRAVALFLSEVVGRTVIDPEPNRSLFDFLVHSIQLLDRFEAGTANFHLCFLIQLSGYLGFYPHVESYRSHYWFDLLNGEFVPVRPMHPYAVSPTEAHYFALLMRMNYVNLQKFTMSRSDRMRILDLFVLYFRLHIDNFKEVKSLEVLKSLFD